MSVPIYNPVIPCVQPLPGGLYPGRMVRVQGNVPPGAQRFAVNLQCGPNTDPRDDIALHLNFRFVEMCVVRNHLSSMEWGIEETAGGIPIQRGQPFEALILCEPQSIKVALNGVHFCEFVHRLPFQRISHLTIDGDVHVQFIGFEGGQPQQQMYMSEPPAYGAYGAPPSYGTPGYGNAPQGFSPQHGAPGMPMQPMSTMVMQQGGMPQRQGLGVGAAAGLGVGALAAGGLAGYALAGGFSSNNSSTDQANYSPMSAGFQESGVGRTDDSFSTDFADRQDNEETAVPKPDDDYLENEEPVEAAPEAPDDDYLENEDPVEAAPEATDDDYLENDAPDNADNDVEAADDDYLDNDAPDDGNDE